jgi:hypothetical protein
MEVNQRICSDCESAVATMTCRCQIPPVDLCLAHLAGHVGKSPEAPHLLVPILPGDLPDEPDDFRRGDKKALYVVAVVQKGG